MSPILTSNDYSLDFNELYVHMWDLATDDQSDGTRLYRPDNEHALKWLIVELAGTPAVPGETWPDNDAIRRQVHAALADGWAHRLTRTSFRLLKPPPARTGEYGYLHDLMSVIPKGRWTTYGELGGLAGIHPIGLGSHIKSCPDCPNAIRVLQVHGQPHGLGFRWTDATRTDDPNAVLREEGVKFLGGRAAQEQFIGGDAISKLLLERGKVAQFDWPTVEWVKDPIDLRTDEPSGLSIQMRHFLDCSHWFRTPQGSLRGASPTLASDEQMRTLPVCGHCRMRAAKAGNAEHGSRLTEGEEAPNLDNSDESEDDQPDVPGELGHRPTDGTALVAVRREQEYLRSHLLAGRLEAPCDLCGHTLPAQLLVAAHITPRHLLSEPERLNFATAAMLACTLGCDALFEHGYIAVDENARIVEHHAVTNGALRDAVTALVGTIVAAHNSDTAARFSKHRATPRLTPS